MFLLIDIGNSYIKFARSDGEIIDHLAKLKHNDNIEFFIKKFQLLSIDNIFLAAVGDKKIKTKTISACEKILGKAVVEVNPDLADFDITNSYPTLGIDRKLAIIAAKKLYNNNFCVIDCGTCYTIDAVDKNNVYQGGYIMPGKKLLIDIFTKTANCRLASDKDILAVSTALATCTPGNMVNGVNLMLISAIKSAIASLPDACKIIFTGGDLELVQQYFSKEQFYYHKNLLFEGLLSSTVKV